MAIVRARATVSLVGLGAGELAWVDTEDPQIARWLRGGQLRELAEPRDPRPPSTPEPEAEVEGSPEVTPASVETPAPKAKRAPARKVTK